MSGRFFLQATPLGRLAGTAIPRTALPLSSFSIFSPISHRYASTATATPRKPAPAPKANETRALSRQERRPHPSKKSIATPRPSDKIRGPYFVNRTPSNLLPVYQKRPHNGADTWLTLVRKIDGDAHTLRDDLVQLLQTPEIQVRSVTNHVWIKGSHKDTIVAYLQSKGF